MAVAYFRFYEELNDFLPAKWRKLEFKHCFDRRASVKDMIESFGVPHTEIEIILVNHESVDFSYIMQDGDRVSVYPVFEGFDVTPLLRLRPRPLRNSCFVVDTNLGKLARYLRLLGLDCLYDNAYTDNDVALMSSEQKRIVLTRDRRLLQRKIITHGYFVRSVAPKLQVLEVLRRLDLYDQLKPFSRCTRCNGELESVEKQCIEHRLLPKTQRYYHDFKRCNNCGQIYWKGSHQERAQKVVNELIARVE